MSASGQDLKEVKRINQNQNEALTTEFKQRFKQMLFSDNRTIDTNIKPRGDGLDIINNFMIAVLKSSAKDEKQLALDCSKEHKKLERYLSSSTSYDAILKHTISVIPCLEDPLKKCYWSNILSLINSKTEKKPCKQEDLLESRIIPKLCPLVVKDIISLDKLRKFNLSTLLHIEMHQNLFDALSNKLVTLDELDELFSKYGMYAVIDSFDILSEKKPNNETYRIIVECFLEGTLIPEEMEVSILRLINLDKPFAEAAKMGCFT